MSEFVSQRLQGTFPVTSGRSKVADTMTPTSLIRLGCMLIGFLAGSNLLAQPSLPQPAIPGLRYYYPAERTEPRIVKCDVCVYGGTSGGAVAAVQAARMGRSVVLLEVGKHIGGLTSGGLNSPHGEGELLCGGVAREFYNAVGQMDFRPSIAEQQYLKMLKQAGVEVFLLSHLDRVRKDGARIVAITMENGLEVQAKQYIDATYEGDLLARAGVSWTAGREGISIYGESLNGIRTPGTGGHNYRTSIDPFREPGNPASGLLPRINEHWGQLGEGDARIQAYCFRMWLTKDNPLPIPKPAAYDPEQYEILARLFEAGVDPRPQFGIDTNVHTLFGGAYFTDFVGGITAGPTPAGSNGNESFRLTPTIRSA